ncbi:hypothetical protein HKD24_09185 [Gluconobacter sp. LMG 31484]|uniref:Phage protein n=1 Tax=Gluconobacter vitians TaxID=2728102 RepID=A0ABR9Y637_9PROT|nr:hypothetical protein [Gluconobacter vitians]MBF0859386.1 hypothetical protein [Gluconobacter vitians]
MIRKPHPAVGGHTQTSFDLFLNGYHPDIHEQARDLRTRMEWCHMLANDYGSSDQSNAANKVMAKTWRESADHLEEQLVLLLYSNRLPDPVPGIPPRPARPAQLKKSAALQTPAEKAQLRSWCDKAVQNLRVLTYAAPREGL